MPLEASISRPDPEMLLRQVQAEEEYAKRGRLKIFLGYMSGVGKSRGCLTKDTAALNAARTWW